MTPPTRAVIAEIAIIALLTAIVVAILIAWLHDITNAEKPRYTDVRPLADYAAEIRRGRAMHQREDMTVFDAEWLHEDGEYSEMLDSLLREIGKKGDVK